MKLYTEKHGIRAPLQKTYCKDMYSLLLDCCEKYQKNLTHIFTLNCHHDFTNSDYVAFDKQGFLTRMRIRIPHLNQNEYGGIYVPDDDEYDQYALLDLIEYYAQNIKDISEHWNNERYKNYQSIDCFELLLFILSNFCTNWLS